MGLGITQALLQHGYRVVANSRDISKSKDLKPSSDLILVDGDIGKMDSVIKVADAAIKHFDRIDLLVNSAGINIAKPFADYTPADFELMIGTNVAGYFFITQRVVTQMRKQKSGHIVGVSTVLVDQPLAVETITLQVVTKSTMPAFHRALALVEETIIMRWFQTRTAAFEHLIPINQLHLWTCPLIIPSVDYLSTINISLLY